MPLDSGTSYSTASGINIFKRLSKGECIWFIIDLILLLIAIALSVILLLQAVHQGQKSPEYTSTRKRLSFRPDYNYSIQLPPRERNGFKFTCSGSLISKNAILTASPCAKNVTKVEVKGKTYQVIKVYGTEMFNVQFQNFTLVREEDLQLKILKISGDLEAEGLFIYRIPPLDYSVVYRGVGTILYAKNGQEKVELVDFIHPFYCHLVYEKYMHVVDYNLMICTITQYENKKREVDKICLKDAIGTPVMQNEVLIGILTISRIDTCGEPRKPFVFINIIPYLQWFDTHNIIFN